MFNVQELNLIAESCLTEKKFLESVEARGIPTANLIASVTAIRAKAMEKAQELQRAELAKAKAEEASSKSE
mgnify:FL=1